MDDAPDLSATEREALIERCPPVHQPLFRGWLEGTHELDGDLVEVTAP